jgi:hypothetical protein
VSAVESLGRLVGEWRGTYQLWLPPDPRRESESSASIGLRAGDRFVAIEYVWSFDGRAEQGLLLVGYEKARDAVTAVWIDSWHMSDKFMICEGRGQKGGVIGFSGSYAAPPGPDWGWRTEIFAGDPGSFRMVMYNVSPDGKEERAVEANYQR